MRLTKEEAIALNELYKHEAVKPLCKKLFNVILTPLQETIVKAVAFPKKKRTVISCMTRYGKSYSVSMGILLWLLAKRNKKIALIAPTTEKTMIIRNYIAYFISMCPLLSDLIDIQKVGVERIRKEVSRKRITFKNGVELRTLSAEGKGEQLMGFGADLVIVDEECDIDFEVYRSRITRMLGDNDDSMYIGIGNPWHRDNQMWQHWTDPSWNRIHIGYEIALTEGRISQEFVDEQRSMLTEREFKILYEANFPEETEDQLIRYSWIMRAIKPISNILKGIKKCGIDVARSGNDSTVLTWGIKTEDNIYIVQGIEEHNQQDTMVTVGNAIKLNQEQNFDKIIIDTSGLGAGVTDRLREAKTEGRIKGEIIAYEGGKSSIMDFKRKTAERKEIKTRFLNTKAEAYFHLRNLFEEDRIIIPKHPKLIDQLTKMKWDITSAEKIRILDPGMAEEDTAEKKSPDFADSLCYFCFEGNKSSLFFGSLDVGPKSKI